MKCKYCGCIESKVVDSRVSDGYRSIRRRRECVACGKRFTTHEIIEEPPVYVIKKGGGRQEFDIQKVRSGIVKACEKRPVPMQKIDDIVEDIQKQMGGVVLENNNQVVEKEPFCGWFKSKKKKQNK